MIRITEIICGAAPPQDKSKLWLDTSNEPYRTNVWNAESGQWEATNSKNIEAYYLRMKQGSSGN